MIEGGFKKIESDYMKLIEEQKNTYKKGYGQLKYFVNGNNKVRLIWKLQSTDSVGSFRMK